jgi:hypothetical protein
MVVFDLSHLRGLALVVGCFGLTATLYRSEAAQASNGPALSVNTAAQSHPISPDVYGINDYSDQGQPRASRM